MTVELNDEQKLKQQFARELLKTPTEGFKIASRMFDGDAGRALVVSNRWPHDPEVLGFMAAAIEDMGDMHFLPTKAETARAAWELSQDLKLPIDERLKALRLFSDIRGFIERQGGITVNQNNITQNKVMLVKDHGSNAEWEHAAASQQSRLIESANAPRTN